MGYLDVIWAILVHDFALINNFSSKNYFQVSSIKREWTKYEILRDWDFKPIVHCSRKRNREWIMKRFSI